MTLSELIWLFISFLVGYIIFWIYSLYRRKYLSSQNKAVLITGCANGFGYELALRLSQMGYQVIAGCRSVETKGARALSSFPGIEVVQLDVTKEEEISTIVKTVSEKLGNNVLWAIVNNAGVSQVGEMEWCPMETLLKLFDVNTFGLIRITKAFLPFIKMSKGRIINMTSMSGNKRLPGFVGYAMSKAAAKSFSNGIRLEMRKWDIQVIEVAPYFYRTSMVETDRINDILNESWKNTDSETTTALGTEYFKTYVEFIHRFLNVLRIPSSEAVIDNMVDAIASESPKLLYEPGNIINTILIDTTQHLPLFLQDFLQSLVLPKLT